MPKATHPLLTCPLLILLATGGNCARAADWTSLLNGSAAGPAGSSVAFPLEKAWEFKAPGYWGFRSSPAVYRGTVYVGVMGKQFYALDGATGDVRWQRPVGGAIEFSSPAVDETGVYVGSDDGTLYAFGHDGEPLWTRPTGAKIECSPLVHGDRVLIGNAGGTILAINHRTGDVIWERKLTGPVFARPTVARDTVYVGTEGFDGGVLYALDLENGEERFTFECGHLAGHESARGGIYAAVLHADGRIYFGSMDGVFYCLDAATGSEVWRRTFEKGIAGSAALADGLLVFGVQDRHWHAIDASNGEERWKAGTDKYYPGLRSPVIVGKTAIVQYEYKVTGLSLADGEIVGTFELSAEDGPADGPAVAVADDRLYTCTRFKLICLVSRSGEE